MLEGPGDSEEVSDMNKMVAKATEFLSFLSVCLSGAVRNSCIIFFSMYASLILSLSACTSTLGPYPATKLTLCQL